MKIMNAFLALCLLSASPSWTLANTEPASLAETPFRYMDLKELKGVGPIAGPVVEAPAAAPSDLAGAKDEIKKLIGILEKQVGNETLGDKARLELFKALSAAKNALLGIEKALAQSGSKAELDGRIAEARFLHRVLGSYFGAKDTFGYRLKQGPIQIEVGGDAAYEAIARKLPFLGGAIGGRVRINPGEAIVTQFNAVKAEFYGVLVEAAHLDAADSRLKAFAEWGKDTNIIYPHETYGAEIITTREYWNLNLK